MNIVINKPGKLKRKHHPSQKIDDSDTMKQNSVITFAINSGCYR